MPPSPSLRASADVTCLTGWRYLEAPLERHYIQFNVALSASLFFFFMPSSGFIEEMSHDACLLVLSLVLPVGGIERLQTYTR